MRSILLAALIVPASLLGQTPSLRQAVDLYRTGKCAEAKPLIEALLKQQPNNATLLNMLQTCDQAGKPAVTESAAKPVPATKPAAAPAAAPAPPAPSALSGEAQERARTGGDLDRAERLIQQNKLDEAYEILAGIEKRLPELTLPRQRMAEIDTRLQRYPQAAAIYASLAEGPGASPVYLLRAAQNHAWDENYGASIPFFERYLAQRTSDADARLELANVMLWSGRLNDAAGQYRQYLSLRTNDTDARFHLAQALLWTGKNVEALEELTRVADRKQGDPAVSLALAQAHEQLGHHTEAIAAYNKVLIVKPADEEARAARDRLVDELPRVRGYSQLEQKDYRTAARSFQEYLNRHPSSDETVLQIARAYSWAGDFKRAEGFYNEYLDRVPEDREAIREAAQVELSLPDLARARALFARLTQDPGAPAEDFEGLIHALVWDGQIAAAKPHAENLLALDSGNRVALETLHAAAEDEKSQALERAQALTADARYPDAVAAYQDYIARYGTSQEIELTIGRLYNWDKQYDAAIEAYADYLSRYPDDMLAQRELADVQKFAGNYGRAEREYRDVLAKAEKDPQALLGLAQISEYRGDDPFQVTAAYEQVLAADPGNRAAVDRLKALAPQVSPALEYRQNGFSDSDGFGRSLNALEALFPMGGGLKVAPFVNLDYFTQLRQVGGTRCGSESPLDDPGLAGLSERICSTDGVSRGYGAGIRFEVGGRGAFSMRGSAGSTRFANNRNNLNANLDLMFSPGANRLLMVSFARRNAAYDVNTIAPLYAGIAGDHARVSYETPVSDRWRLWFSAGVSRYSRGVDALGPLNTQKLFAARAEYRVLPEFSAGYYMRATAFTEPSPLYFSPKLYGVYGFTYRLNKPITDNLRLVADGELGYGRIDRYTQPGVNVVEIVAFPALQWRIGGNLDLRMGYRIGRGRSSAFGSPVYSTGAFEISIQNFFTPHAEPVNPARLDLR